MLEWENVIFDFGQVLVHFEPEAITAAYLQDPADRQAVCEVLFDRRSWDRLDAGTIRDDELKADAFRRLPYMTAGISTCRRWRAWRRCCRISGRPAAVCFCCPISAGALRSITIPCRRCGSCWHPLTGWCFPALSG